MNKIVSLLAAVAAVSFVSTSAMAQKSVEDYFRDKTLTVIVPTSPGGDRAANATVFIRFFGRHIPGNPRVVPSYMPGAGGLVAINYLSNVASRDGLTIATPLTTFIVAQVTGEKAVKYDASKMRWIGRTTESTQVIYVWHTVDAHKIADLKKVPITLGSSGVNSPSTIIPKVINHLLDTKIKVVFGYKGSAPFNLAVERRETDAALTTWGNLKKNYDHWLKAKKARILTQVLLSRHPDLPNVPTVVELANNDEDRVLMEFICSSAEVGQAFIAPQGVPPHIVAALRRAFDATMKDPDYIKFSKRVGNSVNPMSGANLDKYAAKIIATPKKVLDRYKAALAVR